MVKIKDSLKEEQLKKERSDRNFLLIVALFLALITTFVALNTHVFFNVYVLGPSMENTLHTGDVLIANRLKEIERGDIIIVSGAKKGSNDWLIKRVIAVSGETVEIKDGYVFINDKILYDEPYVKEMKVTFVPENMPSKIIVPEGEFFYLGDNRLNSSDSRNYGTCKESQIVGVVENWSLKLKGQIGAFYNFVNKVRNRLKFN